MNENKKRRPIKSREHKIAKKITNLLIKLNVSPNTISVFSIVFSIIGMLAIITMKQDITLLNTTIAIIGIQGRLLCNLFDGMVAIDGNTSSLVGDIYNELPDRISDTLLFLPLGYIGITLPYVLELAWSSVFLALFTAYVRGFGTALGITTFKGIMAKQKRMALLSFTFVLSLCLKYTNSTMFSYQNIIYFMLIILNIGCLLTIITRLSIIIKFLNTQEISDIKN